MGIGRTFNIDRSPNLKPSDVKRFNTMEILLHFINLLNPEHFKTLDPHLQAKLATVSSDLAQIGKDLENHLPKMMEILRKHLGTPSKGSKGVDVLSRLTVFENNYMPNLNIQHDELTKAHEILKGEFNTLVSQSDLLDLIRIENLKTKIGKFNVDKVKNFKTQKDDLSEKVENFTKEVTEATGRTPTLETQDEAPTTDAQPQKSTP